MVYLLRCDFLITKQFITVPNTNSQHLEGFSSIMPTTSHEVSCIQCTRSHSHEVRQLVSFPDVLNTCCSLYAESFADPDLRYFLPIQEKMLYNMAATQYWYVSHTFCMFFQIAQPFCSCQLCSITFERYFGLAFLLRSGKSMVIALRTVIYPSIYIECC